MASRAWLLMGFALCAGATPAFVACSSNDDQGGGDDGGASLPDATSDAGARRDTSPPTADVQTDTAPPPVDGGSGIVGKCEPVQGPACDLVLQDCPTDEAGAQQECLIGTAADGGATTECITVQPSEHLGKGHGCCPGAGDKQCDPGLECIGDPNAPCDGGVAPGRCTPHCCGPTIDGGDDYLCGQSDPEGYQGHCDTQVVDQNGSPLFNACTYNQVCEPFGIKACPAGYACEILDQTGSAGCDTIYVPDGGPAPGEGQDCVALNNCADGLTCLDNGNGTSTCYMMCLTPGSKPPFDGGALDGGPFYGGCPAGKSCTVSVQGFPAWISFCQ